MTIETQISEREREILRLVATGATNQQIAYQLNISVNTVKVHLRNIFGKIGATSRTEATLYAVRTGLVSVGEAQAPLPAPVLPLEKQEPASNITVERLEPAQPPVVETRGAIQVEPTLITLPATSSEIVPPRRRFPRARVLLIAAAVVVLALASLGTLILARGLQPSATPDATTPAGVALPNTRTRWRELAAMPKQRSGFALTNYNYDGKRYLYAMGGETDAGVSDEVVRYDLGNNTWVSMSAKPTAVSDVQSVVIGNKLYVPGGRLASGAISDKLEAYEPQRDRWSTLKPLPKPRSGYALVAFEGKLYLFGGWDGAAYQADVWQYDPDKDEWSARTPMPTARAFAGAVAIDESVYVIGGESQNRGLAVNERYVPADDTGSSNPWTTQAPLPAPASHMATATASGLVFVVAGTDALNRVLIYNATNDAWQADKTPLDALTDLRAQPIGNKLYILGGRGQNAISDRLFEYQAVFTVVVPLTP